MKRMLLVSLLVIVALVIAGCGTGQAVSGGKSIRLLIIVDDKAAASDTLKATDLGALAQSKGYKLGKDVVQLDTEVELSELKDKVVIIINGNNIKYVLRDNGPASENLLVTDFAALMKEKYGIESSPKDFKLYSEATVDFLRG